MRPFLTLLCLLLTGWLCGGDTLSSSSVGPALLPEQLLRLGAPASRNAQDAFFNQSFHMRNGWSLFTQWLNSRGGVQIGNISFLAQLAVVDDSSDALTALEATHLLVHNYTADIIFGPYSSDLTAAAYNITEPADVLLMSASSLIDEHCDDDLLVTLQPPPSSYAHTLFEILFSLGVQTMAVVVDGERDTYCQNSTEFEVLAVHFNISLLGFYTVDGDDYSNSLRSIVLTLQASNVDVVSGCPEIDVAENPQKQNSGICTQLPLMTRNISFSPNGLVFLNCNFDDHETITTLGSAATYLLNLVPWYPTKLIRDSVYSTNWTAVDFYSEYFINYKVPPSYHAAAAFASGTVLQRILEGMEFPHTKNYSSGILLESILTAEGSYFPTIFGNTSFSTCGDNMMKPLMLQVKSDYTSPLDYVSSIVYPSEYTENSGSGLVYPAPSWAARNCEQLTSYCSGHGVCSEAGICQCSSSYYGHFDPQSCDTLCEGEILDGFCLHDQKFYIGGTYGGGFIEHIEHIAHMKHAVELINNKTDGWFDDEMQQVQIILQLEDSGCDAAVAERALENLKNWAITESGGKSELTAVVGAFCSGSSMAIATQANIENLFQISYASTNEALSEVDQYRYFTRTAASDAIQGPLLAKSLITLGVIPFIAVVHLTDSYSSSLATSIIREYQQSGSYFVLLTLPFDSDQTTDEEYHEIIFKVGESGAAAIVFVGYQDIALKIFDAASQHPVLGTSEVLWVGIDAWTGLLLLHEDGSSPLPLGAIGITPQVANTTVTNDYVKRWLKLPPDQYPSTNEGQRDVLATYSSTLVDATVALGLALQHTIDQHAAETDVTGAALFNEMTNFVRFEGVSGSIVFDSAGDLLHPVFSLSNYRSPVSANGEGVLEAEWVVVGNVSQATFSIDADLVEWPGGVSSGSSFSSQLIPWCQSGYEPLLTFSTGVYSCSPCKVGFYKPADGNHVCIACPEGAQCDDTGIAVPCIEYGYWRDPAAAVVDIGDFDAYEIYRCEVHDVCQGGCVLNNSCATDRQRASPVCGVCQIGTYMSDNECYSCTAESKDSKAFRLAIYFLVTFGLTLFLALILFVNLSITPTVSKGKVKEPVEDVFITETLINDMAGSKIASKKSISLREFEMPSRSTNYEKDDNLEKSENCITPKTGFVAFMLRNKNGFKKFVRGASITGKITISFLQVLTGSFLTLNLKYPNYMRDFYVDLQINPFHPIESTFKCADQDNNDDDFSDNNTESNVFFLSLLLSVLSPFIFLLTLAIAILLSRFFYFRYIYPKQRDSIPDRKQFLTRQFTKSYNLSIKLFIWFCLIMYPVLSSNIIGVFNCRDLGSSGIFLRGDYAVSCESDTYKSTYYVAIMGVILIPAGIPIFFATLVYHRHNKWLKQPSFFLHGNFIPKWRYFEVLDLLRKLMLTSIVPYIGEVDSTTQCLFLLVVDTASLVLLASSKPYQNTRDDFLSFWLVLTECAAFLVGVIIISGIDEEDNYNTDAMYACLFAWFVTDLTLIMPLSLAAKFTSVSRYFDRFLTDISTARSTITSLSFVHLRKKQSTVNMNSKALDDDGVLTGHQNTPVSNPMLKQ